MTLYGRVKTEHITDILQQDEYVLLMSRESIVVFNLLTYSMGTARREEGRVIIDIPGSEAELSPENASKVNEIYRDLRNYLKHEDPPGVIVKCENFEKIGDARTLVRHYPKSLSAIYAWHVKEHQFKMDAHYGQARYENYMEDICLWSVTVKGWRSEDTWISRRRPWVIEHEDHYYIFVVSYDDHVEVFGV